jgi:TPR repeat protein
MVCAQWALQDGRPDASVAILTKAAREDRDPEAMRAVGVMLASGELLAKDPEAAIGWFYEAALRGDRPAMRLLANAFRTGTGVATDAKLADYWAKRANR